MRIVFLGTPEFAVPSLDALARAHDIALAVAQPDKPAGRGMKMQAPAVAVRARELGLALAQPAKVRDPEFLARVAALQPDIGIVIAYGKILPKTLLDIPRHGFLNVHASVLPRWRGAAPIQRAIEAGDATTGVTIMRVDEELDHGPMLAVAETPIGADERTPQLAARLSRLGAEALLPVLEQLETNSAREEEQDHSQATYAAKIDKSEGLVRWSEPASTIYNRFRAFDPWPGLFTESLKLNDLEPAEGRGTPGAILGSDARGVIVACGEGALRLLTVQRAGKPRVAATELLRGLAQVP